jgi:Uma2 family endonuclease
MLLSNISWKGYVLLRELLDSPGLRMTYLRGAVELMSPSPIHELWKKNIARFVELYAHVKHIELHGYGSTTLKNEIEGHGGEPDECYLIGKKLADYPEIVLDVVYSAPLLDKLGIYAAMGIAEVWVFRDRAFSLYGLDRASPAGPAGAEYVALPRSVLLPELDFAMVARYAVREDTPQALRELEVEIRR